MTLITVIFQRITGLLYLTILAHLHFSGLFFQPCGSERTFAQFPELHVKQIQIKQTPILRWFLYYSHCAR